ncbi:unnamed protein product [Ectocarpus sp. CCAP 1310/34]|nr:unnamed protein product [Ectocarpus sp. CCAP 1310/34]
MMRADNWHRAVAPKRMGLLLLTMLLLVTSSARPTCANASGSTPCRSPFAFHTPTPPSGLTGTRSRRSCVSSDIRGAQRIANLRRDHQGRVMLRMLLPIMMDSSRPRGKLAATAASGAGDVTAAAAGGGAPAMKTTRLQAFEYAVKKWCDRATSLFPAWVLGAAAVGMLRPAALSWFNSGLITAALATTMVCMGMTLTLDDFVAVARRPRPVMAGVAAQYTVMPVLGFLSGRLFNLPPGLAAGVTLVGCCPGGTASNLVTLIANGDVALSVSMTTVSTLLAAVITGPLTKFLVGALVDISAVTLMKATAQVVFLPVAMGLLLNTRAKGITRRLAPYTPLLCVALVAMICGSVVAANSSILLRSGAALVGAVLTLHAGGFAVGYGGMRACGFTEQEARTTSIEVGMQNSALAVVLAQRGLADPLSAIPGAVSATCHSLIGSALAAYWRTGDRGPRAQPLPSTSTAAAVGGEGEQQQAKGVDLYDAGGGI